MFDKPTAKSDSSRIKITPPAVMPTYHLLAVGEHVSDSVYKLYSPNQLQYIQAINRVDEIHLTHLKKIIVPDTFYTDWLVYAPFPRHLPVIDSVRKLIFISYPSQAFAVYDLGHLIKWGPTSLGKKTTPTPTGLFFTNWRSRKTTSTFNDEWIMEWYFNLDNYQGVSMHQYAMPGYPASHACARLLKQDAMWLYNWCDSWILSGQNKIAAYGTPVIIYGSYNFDEAPPWLLLANESSALHIKEEKLETEINSFLPVILQRQHQRDSVVMQTAATKNTNTRYVNKKQVVAKP